MLSELRYEQLLNAISEYAVLLLDSNGRIEFVNTGANRIFGTWDAKEASTMDLFCPLDGQEPIQAEESLRITAAKIGSTESYGIRSKNDGGKVWIHATYTPIITNKTVNGYSVVLRDLSEKRLAEAKYKSLLDTAPDAILLIDQTGTINLINEKVIELFGYARHELLGMSAGLLFPNNQPNEKIWEEWSEYRIKADKGILVQASGQKADGSSFPVEINFKTIKEVGGDFISCSVRDVTNRNQLTADLTLANKNLKLLHKWLQGIIDSTPNLIVAVDTNLQFVAFNKAYSIFMQRFLGIELKQGADLNEIVRQVPEEFKGFFSDYKIAVSGKTFETEHKTKITGRYRHFKIAYRPITNEQGGLIGATQMVYDISTHREYEEKLSQALVQAESSAKLKQDFLANMSHEIRTPMNAVIGFTRLLLDSKQLSPENHSYAETTYKAAEDLLVIINDILDFSKMEAGKIVMDMIPFDLKVLLTQLKRLFSYRVLDQEIDLKFSIDSTIPDVLISDPTRLNQIFNNLLSNAVKFTQKGQVKVSVSAELLSEEVCIIRFEIADTGIGIKPEQQSQIFSSFHQADSNITRQFGGTGLGLSIVKNLVDLLEGTISLNSVFGEGSVFVVNLPLQIGNKTQLDEFAISPLEEPNIQVELRILLAEDNRNNQVLGKKILTDFGFIVDIANNGQEAITLHEERDYDLILMDIQMPVMDGLTALHIIRKMNGAKGRIPVVALTAHAMPDELGKYLGEGMNACVNKPYVPKDLIRTIIEQVRKNNAIWSEQ